MQCQLQQLNDEVALVLVTHQVRHDDGVHDGGTVLSAQRELQPPRRLTAARVEAVTFQQQVLQLKLSVDAVLNLKTNTLNMSLLDKSTSLAMKLYEIPHDTTCISIRLMTVHTVP